MSHRIRCLLPLLLLAVFAACAFMSCAHRSGVISFYRDHISPIDGERCPMYPSCSGYARTCFEKHGPFMGWIMTCDRLLRCGRDTAAFSKKIVVDSQTVVSDPVFANDFWWYGGRRAGE